MGKHAQLVMGPAGSGKSTYCSALVKHCEAIGRTVHVVNLDPAAEQFNYTPSVDIRDLITIDDVMDELSFGPNGGLIYCMEHLLENMDWLAEQIGDYEDDYLIFDCPGQIELYSHLTIMRTFAETVQQWGYNICGVYLIDSQFISETSKFISGTLMALSAMIQLELPHVNVLTKVDMIDPRQRRKGILAEFLDPELKTLVSELNEELGPRFVKLNEAIGTMIDEWGMVSYFPLDLSNSDSISVLLTQIDNAIQYGEDLEPKEPNDEIEVEM